MLVLQLVGNLFRLFDSSLIQWDVILAVHDAVFVPVCLAMPDKDVLILRH